MRRESVQNRDVNMTVDHTRYYYLEGNQWKPMSQRLPFRVSQDEDSEVRGQC